jgi:hypothetical protein
MGLGIKSVKDPAGNKVSPGRMIEAAFIHQPLDGYKLFYYDVSIGGWTTKDVASGNQGLLLGAGAGLRYDWDVFYVMGGPGVAYSSNTTNGLISTPLEFTIAASVGAKVGKFGVGVYYKHISNGNSSTVIKPNHGLNFLGADINFWSW